MGFFPVSVTVSVVRALNERPGGVNWGAGRAQAEKGIRKSFCKQLVYLHPVKHEQHLLSFSWDVLQSLEQFINQFSVFEFVFITSSPPLCVFPCTALKDQDVRISQRCSAFSEAVN